MKKIKNKNKFAVVLVVISMLFGMFSAGKTFAYFSDTAIMSGNTFTAGTLNFHLNPATDFIYSSLNKGDTASYSTTLVNDGTLCFQYTASTTDIGGDTGLCNYLTLQASLNGSSVYNGSLSGFSFVAGNYVNPSAWNFVVSLPSGANDSLQDKTCNFKITFNGWQENLSNNSQGFSDTAQINATVSSGHWAVTPPTVPDVVLNEILPNPEGDDGAVMPGGEWVELYNNTNSPINLSGYYLRDSEYTSGTTHQINIESCRTNTGGTTISGKGFLVVYRKGIGESCTSHYFELNDTGDTVNFYNSSGNLIDHYTYGNSSTDADSISDNTPGSSNSFTGAESPAQEGKSFARIPDGIGAWVDPIPTPGEPNEMEENVLVIEPTEPVVEEVVAEEPAQEEAVVETVSATETPAVESVPELSVSPSTE